MPQNIIGWDIGGAHVKAVVISANSKVLNVIQIPCPLWKGLAFLNQAILDILDKVSVTNNRHVMTMTGELVDFFESRDQGVAEIIKAMLANLADEDLVIYAGLDGFLKPENIKNQHYAAIASANWLASASLAANKLNSGLFIDIGSTTTDILVLVDNKVRVLGLTDFDRMVSDELVYTGIIRTAVMAVAQSARFKGQAMGLMAEYFATMADVYRLTGELNEAHDQADTADGAEKTVLASAKRLSRMTGYEYLDDDLFLWEQFAENIKSQQKNKIKLACERHLFRNLLTKSHYFIGAGVGRFLVKQLADELGHPYIDFSEIVEQESTNMQINTADCAPAAAVALLYNSQERA